MIHPRAYCASELLLVEGVVNSNYNAGGPMKEVVVSEPVPGIKRFATFSPLTLFFLGGGYFYQPHYSERCSRLDLVPSMF